MYKKWIKRIFDVILSLSGIVLLSPAFFVISIWIIFDSNGPIFFKQKRVGKDKKEFEILKFRTMRLNAPKDMPTHMLKNPEVFITNSGRYLRKYSIDEIPQLINILKGEMSIVGPRPALWNQYDLLEERDRYGANSITPGLTGWAQVNGRDELSISEKASYDGEYTKKLSFYFDCICFLRTILNVIKHKGIFEGQKDSNTEK